MTMITKTGNFADSGEISMKRTLLNMLVLPLLMVTVIAFVPADAQAEEIPFIGEVRMFAGTFAPRGYAFCDGTLLPIAQNTALFSILGTTYGGDGRTTFGLPDLRGRTPIGPGRGPGLSNRNPGQKLGVEAVPLTQAQIPSHNHPLNATADFSSSMNPANNLASKPPGLLGTRIYADGPQNTTMNAASISATGSNNPATHNNMQPFLAINYIIALQGVFPSRN
jgi:microcystin-dependent protein